MTLPAPPPPPPPNETLNVYSIYATESLIVCILSCAGAYVATIHVYTSENDTYRVHGSQLSARCMSTGPIRMNYSISYDETIYVHV